MFIRGSMFALLLATGMLTGASPTEPEPLLHAIQRGDINTVKRLLERGATPNARYAARRSALMDAALCHTVNGVRLLLDHGADPNGSNVAGATALMWAI